MEDTEEAGIKHGPTSVSSESARTFALESPAVIEEDRTIVEVDQLDFSYRTSKALAGISLRIPEKKVTAFIGPSGCGKSTLLRCFNRMNDLIDYARVTAGEIRIDGANIYAPEVDVTELRKRAKTRLYYVSGRFSKLSTPAILGFRLPEAQGPDHSSRGG